jgi:hypothetical protein
MRQDRELPSIFQERIRAKRARDRQRIQAGLNEDLPSWIRWALKPAVGVTRELRAARDSLKGALGQGRASLSFWLALSADWVLMNDVVLEPRPDVFIQLDHVLIGPPGAYLVETKAWRGAFLAVKDIWRRKQGNRWVKCTQVRQDRTSVTKGSSRSG